MEDDNPYLLLTPGPLSTSRTVRAAMLRDCSTWDADYNQIVDGIRRRLIELATANRPDGHTAVLMQGSGTFAVEAVIGTAVPRDGKLLVINNGAYGQRMVQIAERLNIANINLTFAETQCPDLGQIDQALARDAGITHVAMVHCETTTGMMNPAADVGRIVARHGRTYILDAMSSFGGVPMTMQDVGAHFLVSSANKCIQGVPGFGFVVASRDAIESTAGQARSLSLDLYDQWREMERNHGKWRFTSPTHTVVAFQQALAELEAEGGVDARHARYQNCQRTLVEGMRRLGFACLLPDELHSPIITSFVSPSDARFEFTTFYNRLKSRGYVIYPGKVTAAETFRIGTIGHLFPDDIRNLLVQIGAVLADMEVLVRPV
jgi:2-aminoethylphosphonate-pyruvate transaminase